MKEQQLKQINKENTQLKQIHNTPTKQQEKETKKQEYQTISNLPAWNIEPPLEIKRGN